MRDNVEHFTADQQELIEWLEANLESAKRGIVTALFAVAIENAKTEGQTYTHTFWGGSQEKHHHSELITGIVHGITDMVQEFQGNGNTGRVESLS